MTRQLAIGATAATGTREIVAAAREPARAGAGRNMLVVIGIDEYEHWDRLHNAVSDASGARTLFTGLGFEEAVPPLMNRAATRDALDELVNDTLVNDTRTALRPDDSLVVFYAGHGGVREVERSGKWVRVGHLVPVDAARDKFSTWTNLEAWLRAVALLPPRHILVILDACFAGIALGSVIHWRGEAPSTEPLATLQERPSRRIITSALDKETALDNGPIAGHSLFTGALIEALTGGMATTAGAVTGSELATWVRQRVRSFPDARQTPDFGAFDHDERGEIAIPLRPDDDRSLAGSAPAQSPVAPRAAAELAPSDRESAVPGGTRWQRARPIRRPSDSLWLELLERERDWVFLAVSLLIAAVSLRWC